MFACETWGAVFEFVSASPAVNGCSLLLLLGAVVGARRGPRMSCCGRNATSLWRSVGESHLDNLS